MPQKKAHAALRVYQPQPGNQVSASEPNLKDEEALARQSWGTWERGIPGREISMEVPQQEEAWTQPAERRGTWS